MSGLPFEQGQWVTFLIRLDLPDAGQRLKRRGSPAFNQRVERFDEDRMIVL
jgi:hypothetical protein